KAKHHEKYASRDFRTAAPAMRGVRVKAVNEDLQETARGIGQRTLLLWGEHDTETAGDVGGRYSQLVPDSGLITLRGKDHTPFEHLPDLCVAYILEFLQAGTHPRRALS